jgi:hypothetical protein
MTVLTENIKKPKGIDPRRGGGLGGGGMKMGLGGGRASLRAPSSVSWQGRTPWRV